MILIFEGFSLAGPTHTPLHIKTIILYFTDMITAYKGLQKEKEAIESSFKAISGTHGNLSRSASPNVAEHSDKSTNNSGPALDVS